MTFDELLKQASPLPWWRDYTVVYSGADNDIADTESYMCPPSDPANATLITHCVNHFAQLVDALELCQAQLGDIIREGVACHGDEAAYAAAKAALAVAQTIQQST